MLKWIVLIALFCARAQGELDLEKPNFVRTKEMNITRGVTFPFSSRIATASQNSTHIQIDIFKDDFGNAFIQCTVPLSSMKNRIISRLNTVTSDDEIIIWGETSTHHVGDDKRIRFGGIRVKPEKDCEITPLSIGSYQLPKSFFTPLKPVILINKGTAKVFHHQQQDCPSCQFQETDDSFVPTNGNIEGKPLKNFLVKLVHLDNKGDGYFYAYNYENGTAVIRYLTIDGTIINEKYVGHSIDLADSVKNQSIVNVCFLEGVQDIWCGQLDDKLEFRLKEHLPCMEGHIVMSVTISSGPNGEFIVGTVQAKPEEFQKYIVYLNNSSGIKAMDFGQLDENRVGDVYSFYFEESDLYCLHVHETETLGDLESHEIIKCINLK